LVLGHMRDQKNRSWGSKAEGSGWVLESERQCPGQQSLNKKKATGGKWGLNGTDSAKSKKDKGLKNKRWDRPVLLVRRNQFTWAERKKETTQSKKKKGERQKSEACHRGGSSLTTAMFPTEDA